ncbi:MAG: CusA/CzcA family heavy metal efflux RND transporter [Sphingobacteriales bacterium 17-39-43]|uniref:CusA/CzcA family heavy metal efflux RND transporter n=1 Tax=Daejeonella sp. TaxID=2805397 RepID=UPI000BC41138|nr:CusA/CzcA family heavy metal efflux RND transporter [Daejeonella sp.]OYY06021.1 MAG: CusA/CzcA family heavy metal efflux RND transporter [Sphingobacteriia bacterium 35-40-5]OYZ31683.1 MAG: CusA/CzcA family heavy metal efflux RND transporter [Sphingobacteriales bacterium 16-39-50]OZA25078.1 MAG: CusA/CzcA family heavy metal efflux RND transporter [Sphingobacteriales bacterium 17-39-43]HQT22936.1 CusA/CzcA family heavy metal efflux RND transporter [Daejeonella sp.]HQT56956.1 CusA/CzcA family 
MLNKIILFSIKNKLLIGLFTLALIGWGAYSLTKLPIDAVPDITDNQVMVITVTPTLAAQEVERLITFPVEQTMASIPGIKQIRSFSRFGLSLVTVVFNEDVDIYWARQQINERLGEAAKQIPEGVGEPEMAPVTTGLGEIYQYVIHPKKGYEKKYTPMELRTIQDWIIKRQLLGTPGVAEVSGFGGYVKQYEIAVNPDRLRSLNVSISDIFDALETNNQNTGGAYINKSPNAYFIRSEGLIETVEDIEKIVIETDNVTPVLIRDVAKVQFGNSVRYGAATRNGEGEVVTGIVMMLKGANSSEVINAVKARIEQIKKTLPEGVDIEPFLDRKKLVDNAISTVLTNLVEGALIVIFILILFLGNLRAGLVVASVIPLSMLFAISMMNFFGVSGNLMSLGAIDFGLIVDGAVIIVESVLHRISMSKHHHVGLKRLDQSQMDQQVYESSSKMMNSAAFGQIIILIVYLPLLALIGIEGKMFRPMAQTVMFAIIGAFILSLTYVPMMSALGLSKNTTHKRNFSDRMLDFFQRTYSPVIHFAIRQKTGVVVIAVALFLISLFAFTRLGGEFIPQLDEGDFAVETRVLTGSSIDQIIDASTKAQKIILAQFPEVKQVVNKIGSGEIPTDPMPIEAGDMMIILKDKKEWTSASSREELAEKMQEALSVIPGVTFGFQQPIQMRFNELITGAKQDVVIKIYGEDLDVLTNEAAKIGKLISPVEGVNDVYVEEVTGLPQIRIKYNRDRIAQYGLNINAINRTIKTAFAGEAAGVVYEGEKRFDLVVRLDKDDRQSLQDVRGLYVTTRTGQQMPLEEVAAVDFVNGPNQIQRDDTKRRITIGFNVRNRDVESIVEEIQKTLDNKLKLPPGYYTTYGGQFENLKAANARLAIALPVALFLILILLYFTFRSVSQSLLIFTAIPLSAIGGVFALLIRGMSFSISAGVGFIALFGVAVLNGIVLIAEFNRLKKEGIVDVNERVLSGTKSRLRPVLMTAAVASLGFLPMAISNSSGAEVQRPLATVVIGGLITATLLTLIVLPVLYILFERKRKSAEVKSGLSALSVILILLFGGMLLPINSSAQSIAGRKITLDQAIDEAVKNNSSLRAAIYEIDIQKSLKKGSVNLDRTSITYQKGQINSSNQDNHFLISQKTEFPTVYSSQSRLADQRIKSSERFFAITENDLIRQVKSVYYELVYLRGKERLFTYQDSLYSNLVKASDLRYRTGESNRLEKVTSETQLMELKNAIIQNQADILIAQNRLQTLLNTKERLSVDDLLIKRPLEIPQDSSAIAQNPYLKFLEQEINVRRSETSLQQARRLPDFTAGYFNQSFQGLQNVNGIPQNFTRKDRFMGFQIGIGIPILPGGNKAKINASKISEQIAAANFQYHQTNLQGELQQLIQQYNKHNSALDYYEKSALAQADLIIQNAEKGFKGGEIAYLQYLQSMSISIKIKSDYMQELFLYNQSVLDIENIIGKK